MTLHANIHLQASKMLTSHNTFFAPQTGLFQCFMLWDPAELRVNLDETQPSLPAQLKTKIFEIGKIFIKLFPDQLSRSPAVEGFVQSVWELIRSNKLPGVTDDSSGYYKSLFSSRDTIASLVQGVIIPNIGLCDHEMQQFEDEPLEFIQLDLAFGGRDDLECYNIPDAQLEHHRFVHSRVGGKMPKRPSLKYMEAVFREAIHWHIIAPPGIPHATSSDNIFEGYFIPKVSGVTPTSNNIIPYTINLPKAQISASLLAALLKMSSGKVLDHIRGVSLPKVINSSTYSRYFKTPHGVTSFICAGVGFVDEHYNMMGNNSFVNSEMRFTHEASELGAYALHVPLSQRLLPLLASHDKTSSGSNTAISASISAASLQLSFSPLPSVWMRAKHYQPSPAPSVFARDEHCHSTNIELAFD
ncbi:uncharacterized protein F5891DRAFT_981082 [Suillus fuscotomentosus]|uniref:Exportin-2 central domain-containing protein n=1 Tax=Suillus fuscotomentosus TaxID=1912939 RepID=A0AAD4HK76_9AGAM|nr:uncharacterized protein F5891DRAFT_981082 [Suillus fuscotomentosus]KAG1899562.1 hypothetical protein F5891DRAFT_981082 [Suillus fuscotomentosus]